MCDELKVSQLIKILNLYTPADEFEERVSPSFVRKIQNKLQDRATLENEQQVRIKCNRIKTVYTALKFFYLDGGNNNDHNDN